MAFWSMAPKFTEMCRLWKFEALTCYTLGIAFRPTQRIFTSILSQEWSGRVPPPPPPPSLSLSLSLSSDLMFQIYLQCCFACVIASQLRFTDHRSHAWDLCWQTGKVEQFKLLPGCSKFRTRTIRQPREIVYQFMNKKYKEGFPTPWHSVVLDSEESKTANI